MTGTLISIAAVLALVTLPVALPQVQQAPVVAEAPAELVGLTPAQQSALLEAAADGLAAVETAKGRFSQISNDGSITSGEFALRRPGQMRFDYDDPTPIRIIADGTTVAIEDTALETIDRVPIAATPLGMILSKKLDFEKRANVLSVTQDTGRINIALEDKSDEHEGQLVLMMDASDYELLGWWTLDEAGGITEVLLKDVETGVKLDPKLFRIEDPEDDEDEF